MPKNEHELSKEFDNMRLGAESSIEELHQLLSQNKALAKRSKWAVDKMLESLNEALEIIKAV